MRAHRTIRLAALIALAAGCARGAAVPEVRFANAPAVAAIDDRRDVPKRPRTREFARHLYHFDGSFYRLVQRGLELPRPQRALGVNALDEVPDSTWFTNRIGVRDLSLDELRRGAATAGSPELYKPWTIHSTKVGGASVGFIITDTRGVKFLLKFDRAGFPEIETANEIITSKLLWACGFNVAEDHVVYLRPEDLAIAPDAIVKDWSGVVGPLDRARLERSLATIVHEPDGRIRAMASRMIDGKAIGGHAAEGVRADDPNDRIPHELRRDLRGMAAFFAWLDHTDVKEDNTLDMWTTDPADPKRHYVKHYLLDFGGSLGGAAVFTADPREGHAYRLDFPDLFRSLVTLGLPERSWERRTAPALRGVGLLDIETYDPGAWKPETPAYVPFRTADDTDRFWAAKILIRFTREQLHAVVETARLSDPRAVEYVTDALVARQRATARHWFSRVSPLDRFAVEMSAGAPAGTLCFDDLMLAYGLEPVAQVTRYALTSYDRSGRPLGATADVRPGAAGRACAPVTLASGRDAYSIVRIETRRLRFRGQTYVHVARDPASGAPRVIGVWRR
jgi:hypothetical protein